MLTLEYDGRVHTYLLRQCRVCVAPLVSPAPPDMTLDLIKEGPASGPVHSFVTPHRAGCRVPVPKPEPGTAIRISGDLLTLDVDEQTPFPHAFIPFTAGAPAGPVVSDWCGYGAMEQMLTGRGFCGRGEGSPIHLPVRLVRRGTTFPHVLVRRMDGTVDKRVPLGTRVEPVGLPDDGSVVDLDVIVYRLGGEFMVLAQVGMAAGDSVTFSAKQ